MIFNDRTSSISRLYRSTKAEHHLVQDTKDLDEKPYIPGLTPRGFQRWQTLMILAHPDKEYERLSKALLHMPINNPDDGGRFPKEIPRALFPTKPDLKLRQYLDESIVSHCDVKLPAPATVAPPPEECDKQLLQQFTGTFNRTTSTPSTNTKTNKKSVSISELPQQQRQQQQGHRLSAMVADANDDDDYDDDDDGEEEEGDDDEDEQMKQSMGTTTTRLEREWNPYTSSPAARGGGREYTNATELMPETAKRGSIATTTAAPATTSSTTVAGANNANATTRGSSPSPVHSYAPRSPENYLKQQHSSSRRAGSPSRGSGGGAALPVTSGFSSRRHWASGSGSLDRDYEKEREQQERSRQQRHLPPPPRPPPSSYYHHRPGSSNRSSWSVVGEDYYPGMLGGQGGDDRHTLSNGCRSFGYK